MSGAPKARLSSVANSIRLLGSFSGEENELGITVLASRLRLAKSTVHRLAATLTSARFLEQNPETGKYRLGLALFELGITNLQTPLTPEKVWAAIREAKAGRVPG